MSSVEIKSGIVTAIEGKKIRIRLEPVLAEGCGTSCHCKAVSIEKHRGPQVWVPLENAQEYQVGHPVLVRAQLPSPYLGIFLVFVLPIACLIAGAFFGNEIALHYRWERFQNLASLLSGGVCFLLSILFALGVDRLYRQNKQAFSLVSHPNPQEVKSCCQKHCKKEE